MVIFDPEVVVMGIQTLLQNDIVRWFLIFLVVVLSIDLVKKMVDLFRSIARKAV